MTPDPLDGTARRSVATMRPGMIVKPAPERIDRTLPSTGRVEQVAVRMMARYGANAAREATVQLNRMIDRANWPARDLWACVVHVIHEHRT